MELHVHDRMRCHPGIRTWYRLGTTVVGGCRCRAGAKHPVRTLVRIPTEASLSRGVMDSIKGTHTA
jgi:hypothetical protein